MEYPLFKILEAVISC